MPRSTANKNYRTFVAGMITEASPLTYPENASTDEDNCIIYRKGNRTRRLGFKTEQGSASPFTFSTPSNSLSFYTNQFSWEAVNEKGSKDFYVNRVGDFIYFYDSNQDPVADSLYDFVIDLRAFKSSVSDSEIKNTRIGFASGRGYLFVAGEQIDPFSVEYNEDTDTFIARPISIRIRDFVGLEDGLDNDFEPINLSKEHHYNLRNQGWVAPSSKIGNTTGTVDPADGSGLTYTLANLLVTRLNNPFGASTQGAVFSSDPITTYKNQIGVYPANNKAWWVGRLEADDPDKGLKAGDFDPETLCDTFFGNTLAARGHYILDAFNRDRSTVSGVAGIPTETKTSRPSAISFYAGRVFYGHESDIYYSQTLKDYRQAGSCFQEADPTSEGISDLIATDGGLVPIPEAHNIRRLYPIGGSLLVFAENGVWSISGGGGNGFSATDIAVSKISSNGILSPDSLVEATGNIYWWSAAGIMSLAQKSGLFGTQEGVFDRQNISETTIQSFYNNRVPDKAKEFVKGYYDPARNLIQWFYKSNDASIKDYTFFDSILNLDVTLQAFYPWSMDDSNGKTLIGAFRRVNTKRIKTPGIQTQEGQDTFNSFLHYVCVENSSSGYKVCFGDFESTDYLDFGSQPFLSFMETGFELLDDLMRNKQANYVFLNFRRTDDEDLGVESSCYFQSKWDWSRSSDSNRWSRKVQGYRITPRFDKSYVVSSKLKTRGHGRALQLRFETDEPNKTFDLLGWASSYSGNTTV